MKGPRICGDVIPADTPACLQCEVCSFLMRMRMRVCVHCCFVTCVRVFF